MAKLPPITFKVQADLAEFRTALAEVLDAAEEFDAALTKLAKTEVKATVNPVTVTATTAANPKTIVDQIGYSLRNIS